MDSAERDQLKADQAKEDDVILGLEEEVQTLKREIIRLRGTIRTLESDGLGAEHHKEIPTL